MEDKSGLTSTQKSVIISDSELELLEELRKVNYGRVTIFVEKGQPVRIEETVRSIKLQVH